MDQKTIYVLQALAKDTMIKFSLGAFKSKSNALKAKEIQDEVTGTKYYHFIEEEIILD